MKKRNLSKRNCPEKAHPSAVCTSVTVDTGTLIADNFQDKLKILPIGVRLAL